MNRFAALILLGIWLLATGTVLAEPVVGAATSGIIDDDGFVTLTDSDRPSVDGKALLIAAYSIILGGLAMYSFSLLFRQQRLNKSASDLKKRIANNLQDPH